MTVCDVVILCGGRGTRLHPDVIDLPKPLVTIGGTPIVDHVMQIYARQLPEARFVLATGHLGHLFAERYRDVDSVVVVDTGDDAGTGERLRRAREHVDGTTFFATYGDGLANIDLASLLETHRTNHAQVTITAVPLPSPYGTLQLDDRGRVCEFLEKPVLFDHWINGGFFVVERGALDQRGNSFEDDVLPQLVPGGHVHSYRHHGFWRSMDTFKDRQELDALATDEAPWRG